MRVFANKKLVHRLFGKENEVQLFVAHYANGRTALELMCEMEEEGYEKMLGPYMRASINFHNAPCAENEVYIKDYSENEGIAQYLVDWGVIEPTPSGMAGSGHVVCARHRFTAGFMMEMAAVLTEGKNVGHGG